MVIFYKLFNTNWRGRSNFKFKYQTELISGAVEPESNLNLNKPKTKLFQKLSKY